jgi:hypothetical protein
MPRPALQPGVYQHFKGGLYQVLGVARLVDSSDWFVVYRPLSGEQELVMRPFAEFAGSVTRDGREQARFQFVRAYSPDLLETPFG